MVRLGVAFASVLLSGCIDVPGGGHGDGHTGGPLSPTDTLALAGPAWRLAAVDGARPDSLPGGDALISIGFSERPFGDLAPDAWSFGGYNGCNDFGMAYWLDGDPTSADGAAFRGGAVFSDAMACGEAGEHVSDVVFGGFGSARRVRLDAGRLAFFDSLGAERLAFVPRPVRPVDSVAVTTGRWQLDPEASTVRSSDGGPAGRYTVAFAPDGTYRGEAGCRTFSGTYTLAGDRFTVSSYALDDRTCALGDRMWDGPHGIRTGEIEADADRLVVYVRQGDRAVFVRP